jgi:hypothetical protein
MTVPPEAGSSAGAGEMPIPEMNAQPQPGGTQSRSMSGTVVAGTGEMPIREMNAAPQPGGSRPMSGTEVAGTGEMPIQEMNAEPQQPGGAPVETAHEREKLSAYLRDRQGSQASKRSAGAGEMPAPGMNASG